MNPENESERPGPAEASGAEGPTPTEASPEAERAPNGTADVQAYIGRQLRAVYDDVVRQPIPDRFLALMQQLENATPKG